MTLQLPNMAARLVTPDGYVRPPWNSFFQQFTDSPSGVMSIIIGASPLQYKAGEPGTVFVTGGTITSITLTRGAVSIDVGNARNVVVCRNDIVTIDYSVAPTAIQFVPFYSTQR